MPKSNRGLALAESSEPKKITTLEITDQIWALVLLRQDAKDDQERAAVDGELSRLVAVDLARKVDGIGSADRRMDAEDGHLQQEQARITRKRKKIQNAKRDLRNLVVYAMEKLGTDVIHGRVDTIYKNEGKYSLEVFDESSLPRNYIQETIVKVRRDDLIRQDLEANVDVPGARLKKGEDYISIR
jgi:hypothetical protein